MCKFFGVSRSGYYAFVKRLGQQVHKYNNHLSELSERERYVFFNRALDEKSLDELALELGLSYKCVAAIYYRAIQKIKKDERGVWMSFQEILLRAKLGDETAKQELFDKYYPLT